MAKGLAGLDQKTWVGIGVGLAVLVILLIVRKDVLRWLSGEDAPLVSQEDATTQVEDVLADADPVDDSVPTDEFAATAMAVADSQYQELTSWSQDEYAMMAQLQSYDGAQLQQIFEAFGARLYDGGIFGGEDTYMNLFGFYAEELDNSLIYGNEITLDWDDVPEQWRPTNMEDCSGIITGGCTEKQAFRAIWWRSGLPLTF